MNNQSSNVLQVIKLSQVDFSSTWIKRAIKEHELFKQSFDSSDESKNFKEIVDYKDEDADLWEIHEITPFYWSLNYKNDQGLCMSSVMYSLLNVKEFCGMVLNLYNETRGLVKRNDYEPFYDLAKVISANYAAANNTKPRMLDNLNQNFFESLLKYFNGQCFKINEKWDAFYLLRVLIRYFDQTYIELSFVKNGGQIYSNKFKVEGLFRTKLSRCYLCFNRDGTIRHKNMIPMVETTYITVEISVDLHLSLIGFFKSQNFREKSFECPQCKSNQKTRRRNFIEGCGSYMLIKTDIFEESNGTLRKKSNLATMHVPLELSMRDFVFHVKKSPNTLYKLVSVIFHEGRSIKNGRFTSLNYNWYDKRWRYHNSITNYLYLDEDKIEDFISVKYESNESYLLPYVLIYQNITLETNLEYEKGLQARFNFSEIEKEISEISKSTSSISQLLPSGKRKVKAPDSEDRGKRANLQIVKAAYGLKNFGNTCYLNALLQQFFNLELFKGYIHSLDRENRRLWENSTFFAFILKLVVEYDKESNKKEFEIAFLKFFDDCYLKNEYHFTNVPFKYGDQHDVDELLKRFVEIFDRIVEPRRKMEHLMNFRIRETITCPRCKTERVLKHNVALDCIDVDILVNQSTLDGLVRFLTPEILDSDFLCQNCNAPAQSKQVSVNEMGRILIFRIGFFRQFGNYFAKQQPKKVILCDKEINFYQGKMYALNGVVFHEGDSVNSGHYTSLCFNKSSNSWIYFDDDQPLRVLDDQEDQPNKFIQEEYKRSRKKLPYLVFYSEIGLGSTTSAVQIDDVDEINEQAEESEEEEEEPYKYPKFDVQNKYDEASASSSSVEDIAYEAGKNSDMEVEDNSDVYIINDPTGEEFVTPKPGTIKKTRKTKSSQRKRREDNRKAKQKQRSNSEYKAKGASYMRDIRADFDSEMATQYREKDLSRKNKLRSDPSRKREEQDRNTTQRRNKRQGFEYLIKQYFDGIQEGPTSVCTCCGGLFFPRSVKKVDPQAISDDTFRNQIFKSNLKDLNGNYFACKTCKNGISSGKVPTLALSRGLDFKEVPEVLKVLNDTERSLLSPRLSFLRLKKLGWDQQKGMKGNVVNVPIDVQETLQQVLPRKPSESFTMQLRLMRKMDYKNPYKFETISPYKIVKALEYLKSIPNGIYKEYDVQISEEWLNQYAFQISQEGQNSSVDYIVEPEDSGVFNSSETGNSGKNSNNQSRSSQSINLSRRKELLRDSGLSDTVFRDLLEGDFFDESQVAAETNPNLSQISTHILNMPTDGYDDDYLNISRNQLIDQISKRYLQESDGDSNSDEEGNVDYFCSQNRYHKDQPTLLDNVVSIAPGEGETPLYFADDKHAEECQFFHLYAGLLTQYPKKLSKTAIYKSEIRRYDRRFAEDITALLYKFKMKMTIDLRKAVDTALRKTTVFKGGKDVQATAGMVLDKEEMKKFLESEEALLFLRAIRQTPQFWEWKKTEINAMIRQCGTPNFFITLSPSEINWFELIVILVKVSKNKTITVEEAKRIPRQERIDLVTKDPVTCARYFENKLRHIMKFVFARNGVFRNHPVKDYFWRIDFQYRGSPHCHMLIWLHDVPLYDEEIDAEKEPERKAENLRKYAEFVDSYVTCKRPDDDMVGESDDEDETLIPSQSTLSSQTPSRNSQGNFHKTPINTQRSRSSFRSSQTPSLPPMSSKTLKNRARSKLKIDFLFHGHRKKNCMIKDNKGNDICKYNFPKPILDRTTCIEPFDRKKHGDKEYEKYYDKWIKIRDELEIVYQEFLNNRRRKVKLEEFLQDYLGGMSREDYIKAISCSLKRVVVFLRRESHEVMVNNYNKIIYPLWGSNMDMQEVSDPYGCASYVSAYMLKSNAVMSKLLRQCHAECKEEGNLSVRQKFNRIANKFQNCHEVSAQEAVYTLLSMPVSQSSREVIYVNTFPSEKRSKVLMDVEMLRSLKADSTSIYKKGLIDHYTNRPDNMESVCLAEFAACYNHISDQAHKNIKKGDDRPLDDKEVDEKEDDEFEDMFENRVFINQQEKQDNLEDYLRGDTSEEEQADVALKKDLKNYARMKNKDGYVSKNKRKVPRILRYKRYNLRNHKQEFFRVQNMLYVPWRNEKKELENVKDKYELFTKNKDIIKKNQAEFEHSNIEKIIAAQKDIDIIWRNEADARVEEQVEKEIRGDRLLRFHTRTEYDDEDLSMSGSYLERVMAEGYSPEDLEEEFGYRANINDVWEFRNFAPDRKIVISIPKRIKDTNYWCSLRKMNKRQKIYLKNFIKAMKSGKPFYHFLRGGSGTGKSFLINLIYQTFIRFHQDRKVAGPDVVPDHTDAKILCIVGAFTGKAAFNVRGDTVARLFRFPFMLKKYIPLANDARKKMEDMYKHLKLIIIDEISMIGANLFAKMDLRMREIRGNHTDYFGGLPVLVVGDFNQIPPIGDGGMIYNDVTLSASVYPELADNYYWQQFQMFELTQIMRQNPNEVEFAQALNSIGDHFYFGLTESQIKLLDSRIVSVDKIPENAIHLFCTRQNVADRNSLILKDANIICKSIDTTRGKEAKSIKARNEIRALQNNENEAKMDVLGKLPLKVGCKYMITINQDVEDGLTNGTTGVLRNYVKNYVTRPIEEREMLDPKRLYFEFEEDVGGKVREDQENIQYYKNDVMYNDDGLLVNPAWTLVHYADNIIKTEEEVNKDFTVIRIQYPMVPCEALTIHKSQGQTYKAVAIALDQELKQTLLYVGLSRVTSVEGLFLYYMKKHYGVKTFLPLTVGRMTAEKKRSCIEAIELSTKNVEMKGLRNERSLINSFPFMEADPFDSYRDRQSFYRTTRQRTMTFMMQNIRGYNSLKRDFINQDDGFINCDYIMLIGCGNKTFDVSRHGPTFDYCTLNDNFENIFNTHSTSLNHQNGQLCFANKQIKNLIELCGHNADPDSFVFRDGTTDAVELSMFKIKRSTSSKSYLYVILVYRHPGGNLTTSWDKLMNGISQILRENNLSAEKIFRNLDALIIVGDFNIDFNSKEHERRLSELQLTFGVRPVFGGNLERSTERIVFQTHDKGKQIDWVFTSIAASDVNRNITAMPYETLPIVSDHIPIYMSVVYSYDNNN